MKRNINELQLLRGFGIVAIMIDHTEFNLFPWQSEAMEKFHTYFSATAGMDMFFALSGFVIARLLFSDFQSIQDRFSSMQIVSVFWLRRAWRLLPAAWLWLTLTVLLALLFNQHGSFGAFRDAWSGALTAYLQVANLKFGDCFMHYSCGPTFPYWSLSLEEQFYIFLPLLMIFSGKWFVRILLVLAFTQMFVQPLVLPDYMRLQGFLLGVLLAVWSRSPTYRIFEPKFLGKNKLVRWATVSFLMMCMFAMSNKIVPQFMIFQLSAIIGAILVFIASFDQNYLWKDGWLKTLGLWLGSRAYAMYLCHIPVFLLTRELCLRLMEPGTILGPEHFWYLLAGGVSLVVVLSEATYSLIERPLRSRGMSITNQMKQRQQAEREAAEAGKTPLID